MTSSIASYGLISSMGSGKEAHQAIFSSKKSGLTPEKLLNKQETFTGKITGDLESIPVDLKIYQSRNNQLLLTVFQQIKQETMQAIEKYGSERVAIIIGTSTSGMSTVEEAFIAKKETAKLPREFDYKQHEMGSPAEFLRAYLKVEGPAYTVSCACSSGAKALAAAARLLDNDICDAVICGGVDSLCHLTLAGFNSLEVISAERCNPFSANRQGINIGEAAALFLLNKEPSHLKLLGYGESSDAHHQSAPHPEGEGAEKSMTKALEMAKLTPPQIDYINLHGTGTTLNDSMESKAVNRLFGNDVACSSTKGYTGHTLGAAGALEAAFCCLSLENQQTPLHLWDDTADKEIAAINLSSEIASHKIKVVMSNSFAFGGNNCSLILGLKND